MHIISKQGSADNVLTYEHICDTAADMAAIERKYITLGSVCIVLQGESGAMEVYMADSDKEWHDVIVTGGSSGSGESAPAGLSLYICTSSEVANGKPDVEAPMEGVLYLVPSGNQSGNLYDEYIYVNDAWELFGGASIDLTGYVTTQEMNSALAAKANSADIPAWAKAAQKPTYTAQEVGALPANTTIPTKVSDLTNDSDFVSLASQPTEDGTALVYVNGAWKAQKGYGYGDNTKLTLLTASNFTEVSDGYYQAALGINPNLTEDDLNQAQSIMIDIFLSRKEFEVKIDDTVYNSVQDNFIYDENKDGGLPDIYLESSDGNHRIFYIDIDFHKIYTYGLSTSAEIIGLYKNYTKISEDLLPTIPVKAGEGQNSTIEGVQTSASEVASHAEGFQTSASGQASHAEGSGTIASGNSSHAEGDNTKALGGFSHAEGILTHAFSRGSHAEGRGTYDEEATLSSTGEQLKYQCSDTSPFATTMIVKNGSSVAYITDIDYSNNIITMSNSLGSLNETPVELYSGVAYADGSHSEGKLTLAYGENSHSEGSYTFAYGADSHAEGSSTKASGLCSHAEGSETTASDFFTHAEGYGTTASRDSAHAEGQNTKASDVSAHAEGTNTIASGQASHAEGLGSQISTRITGTANSYEYLVDSNLQDITKGQFVIVGGTSAIITDYDYSNHIITVSNILRYFDDKPITIYTGANGDYAHSEGEKTTAFGEASHAEGSGTIVSSSYAHAEGYETTASGDGAHAEGDATVASGFFSHAEGSSTTASDYHAHAEGENTVAAGEAAHAEGADTTASVFCSHSEGLGTTSAVKYQHVQGKYNVADTPDNNDEGIYADIVGNGDDDENLSNAYALTWTGDGHYAGDVYVHSNGDSTGGNKLATEAYVTNAISASTQTVSGTTPTVTATANTTYVCGTVSTLSFTPAASGISDILFTSGSTATVLTVPNTVKFPDWFDPSNLSANTTYEISVMNGTYGAVMAWATT